MSADALSSVEVVGGSTRIPMLARLVEDVLKKAPSRTLNAKECVSRGAALQCAMLSPVFKASAHANSGEGQHYSPPGDQGSGTGVCGALNHSTHFNSG